MKTTWKWIATGLGVALCMTACGDASSPAAGQQDGMSPGGQVETDAGAGPATSYERATRALSESRMLSPAGDNAVEHYLAARADAAEQVRAQAALAELQPYVLIAAEQAIARGDVPEASRLQGLIERIDTAAPALPRLRAEVAALVREQAAQAATAAEPPPSTVPAATAATRPVTPPAPASAAATVTATAPEPPPAAQSAPAPVVAAQEETRPSPPPAASPRVVQGPRTPRLLQDAQPRYPLPALRARIEGQAEVAFTIQPDGSVRDVRLLSSTPAGMFDASALAVAQRWRFEATGQAHTSSRTVRFRLPAAESRDG
jgi:periplasmic protein TonB